MNTVLPNFRIEGSQTTSRAIKEWQVEQGILQLFANSHQPLSAQLATDQKILSIGRECIQGIPGSIQHNPSKLETYLKDTYARLVPIGQEEYHIQVSHRLEGGMNDEKVPSS